MQTKLLALTTQQRVFLRILTEFGADATTINDLIHSRQMVSITHPGKTPPGPQENPAALSVRFKTGTTMVLAREAIVLIAGGQRIPSHQFSLIGEQCAMKCYPALYHLATEHRMSHLSGQKRTHHEAKLGGHGRY